MSLSYRKPASLRLAISSACTLLAAAVLPAGAALAADTYVQPQVDLRVEANDNWDLVPGGSADSDVYGYVADLQALIGIATPRSDTSMRPRILLQEYPDRSDIDAFEAFFDVRSQYNWERSNLFVLARYQRQDIVNYNRPVAGFDEFDPNAPPVADSGRSRANETLNRVDISPTFTFNLSERTRIGAAAYYQAARYNSDGVQTSVDYDYAQGSGFFTRVLGPRNDVTLDAYVSKYEPTDSSTETVGTGGGIGYKHRWSEIAGIEGRVFYEQNDIDRFEPVRTQESTSGWGGNVTSYLNGPVSQWRVTVEQAFYPTGDGGKQENTQFRAQYGRALTQRWNFDGAALYLRARAISTNFKLDDRDYARLDVSLRWALTRTFYLSGGYSYTWQEYVVSRGSADNNRLFVSFGYQGLAGPGH